jgi:hypothetical protein
MNQKAVWCEDCKVFIRRLYVHYDETNKQYHNLIIMDGYKK